MPVYATRQDLIDTVGASHLQIASDVDLQNDENSTAITAALRAASREIESYASAHGLVPDDVGTNDPATADTYPIWWNEAAKWLALYWLPVPGGPPTWVVERAELIRKQLAGNYPRSSDTVVAGGTVSWSDDTREFSRAKQVGL